MIALFWVFKILQHFNKLEGKNNVKMNYKIFILCHSLIWAFIAHLQCNNYSFKHWHLYLFIGWAAKQVGSWFHDKGSNPDPDSESTES